MIISSSNMMQSVQNIQAPSNVQSPFANTELVTDLSDDAVKTDISEAGRRIGHMMERMGQMGGPEMEEKMTEMKTSIEELGLSELDLDSMSDEEIAEVAQSIHNVMENFKPEHLEGTTINLDSMSSEDLELYVTKFNNNATEVLDSMGKMEGMMMGRPPMGGKPPAGGKPPMGGKGEDAISAYESIDTTSDEEDQLDMLELLVEALQTDENSNESTDDTLELNTYKQLISEYLSVEEE